MKNSPFTMAIILQVFNDPDSNKKFLNQQYRSLGRYC